MNLKTTLLLLVLLALLAGAMLFQKESEATKALVDVRLFGDADASQVETIRIDNIQRSYNLRLERDSQGVWYMTDPIRYPADMGTLRILLEDIAGARGLVVPEQEWGAKELGFDPPRIVVEVDERTPTGMRTHQVEIGAPDMDRVRLNVRVDGLYLRSLVRLYTTLNYILDDFRSKRALTIAGEDVIEVHRKGHIVFDVEEEAQDLELHAIRDGLDWRSLTPVQSLLSGMDLGILVFGSSRLLVSGFVDDEVVDLAPYGLDYPEARIDLKTSSGLTEVLLLSRVKLHGTWYAKRQDAPFVWSLDPESALRVLYPTEEMYDRNFMRALRRDVNSVELDSGTGTQVLLERIGEGWVVQGSVDGVETGEPIPADVRRVEDLLARLESLELSLLPEGISQPTPSELLDLPPLSRAIHVDVGGQTLGGRVGRLAPGWPGLDESLVLFRRRGDDLLLAAEDWLLELAQTPFEEFRSKHLVDVTENRLTRLTVSSSDGSRSFVRDGRGIWHPEGEDREAKDLLDLLDPLIYLKAETFLAPDEPLVNPIELVFELFEGGEERVIFGAGVPLDGSPTTVAEVGGSRSQLKVGSLHGDLLSLVRP